MLNAGSKLGPYEITGAIGAGGMGEVYRARDTKLGRDVALKVLPEAFARDVERMARFKREAQVLASLNHPNLAAIYGFEDSSNTHALVMELVEGPTLAERIKAGAIPLDEALPIAKQITEGLEYAHERGIVHRDLKPSNVKVTPQSTVKILDFGLAKAIEGDAGASSVESSPTLSAMATRAGFLLGTAAYMSPEQARGKAADRRADIWAFGVVLYEMLSGLRLFIGETTSDTLAAVIRAEPDWTQLPRSTPQTIRNLLRRCLQKDPRQRLQAIGDARIAIEEAISGTPDTGELPGPLNSAARKRESIAWGSAALLLIIATLATIGYYLRAPQPASAIVSEISPPPDIRFLPTGNFSDPPALSPDGKWLAFGGRQTYGVDTSQGAPELWLRALDSTTARPLAGTAGAMCPFWSPDARSIGYFAKGSLNRVDASGGPPLRIADAPEGFGATWGRDGTILFTPQYGPIYRVPATGGTPQPVTTLNSSREEVSHRWPQFLPDGRHFLFYVFSHTPENDGTYVVSLEGGEPKLIVRGESDAVYAPPGYLLFVGQGQLMAQRFDAKGFRLSGEAIPLAQRAGTNLIARRGIFTASENTTLSFSAPSFDSTSSRLLWFDRNGKQMAETGVPAQYAQVSLSPDGQQLAVVILDAVSQEPGVWVYDVARNTKKRLTFSPGVNAEPAWSPNGKVIAFNSNRGGRLDIYEKAADGTGSAAPVMVDDSNKYFPKWSSDGRYLLFQRGATSNSNTEIWALPLFGARKPFPVVQDKQFNASDPAVSPNGRWLAYVSDESRQREVYVVPFPHGSGKWLVSTGGGGTPLWRRDGKELLYISADRELMSAQINEQATSFRIGQIAPLFLVNPPALGGYDISADGKKFVVVSEGAQQAAGPLTLVTNWPELLKKQQ